MIVLYVRQNNLKYFMPRFRSNLDYNCINFYTAKYEYLHSYYISISFCKYTNSACMCLFTKYLSGCL